MGRSVFWLIIFALRATLAPCQSCPNWSARFDGITDQAVLSALRVNQQAGWNVMIDASGGPLVTLKSGQYTLAILNQRLPNNLSIIRSLSASGQVGRISASDCSETGPLSAAKCDYYQTQQQILAIQGTIDIVGCYAAHGDSMSSGQSRNLQAATRSGSAATTGVAMALGALDNILASRKADASEDSQPVQPPDLSATVSPLDSTAVHNLMAANSTKAGLISDAFDRLSEKDSDEGNGKAEDGKNMLDASNHLKPQFVGITSGSSAESSFVSGGVTDGKPIVGSVSAESNLSDCHATIDATLNGGDPAAGGIVLRFSVKVGSGVRPATEFGGVVLPPGQKVGYEIETTIRTSAGNVESTRQRFEATLSVGLGDATVFVPISGTQDTRDELLGWRVVKVTCPATSGAATPTNCPALLDFRDHELASQQLVLIKKYGVYDQGKGMIESIRQQLIEDVSDGVGEHQQLLIKITALTDFASGVYGIAFPEGKAIQSAASLSQKVYKGINDLGDDVLAVKDIEMKDLLSAVVQQTPNLNPMETLGKTIYSLAKDMQDLREQRELKEMFVAQLDKLDGQMASYDEAMRQALAGSNAIDETRKGITMACAVRSGTP